ncbi:hypothetical protein SGGMMB4_02108 [Sodalis glossinidius str. 'morsitans']|uniref:Uncharacterized protein n=1 Tax=Sodalis glossinidius (strain morsitans) TaxID=343509 RepID=A0A193QI01_SODGM|nr:hypothetical protein SGGMMB4_02108 [Sodalis glossinidius str. 'morsitans']
MKRDLSVQHQYIQIGKYATNGINDYLNTRSYYLIQPYDHRDMDLYVVRHVQMRILIHILLPAYLQHVYILFHIQTIFLYYENLFQLYKRLFHH